MFKKEKEGKGETLIERGFRKDARGGKQRLY